MTEKDKKDIQEKINKLSMMEQQLQQLLAQKQQFQSQLLELDSALEELGKSEKAYRIIGNVMVSAGKDELIRDISQKKETAEIRIKNLEKQETSIREKTSALQSEVMKGMS